MDRAGDPASKGAPRQLVVLCHGLGADGHDLIDLAPTWGACAAGRAVRLGRCAVRATIPGSAGNGGASPTARPPVVEAGVRRAATFLGPFIDAELARLNLPADAYALMGFSQGAMTVLFTGLRHVAAAARHPGLFRRADRARHPGRRTDRPPARPAGARRGGRGRCRSPARTTPRPPCAPPACRWRRPTSPASATASTTPASRMGALALQRAFADGMTAA